MLFLITTNSFAARVDVGGGGGGGNSFETISVPAGTNPVADSSTDTLIITETSPLVITGTAGTDTIDITVESGADFDSSGLIKANSVALGTDTTGNYAAGDAEAGAALTGDTATEFFSVGTLEDARLPTSMADKVITGSLAIPQGTAPTVDAVGEIAVDTTDDQLIYYGGAKRVIPYERTICAVIEDLAAADDNFAFYMANDAVTVTNVGCNCRGTCTVLATFTLEDRGGVAMTITGTNPTCATTGAATFAAVTAGNGLTAGEMVAFDVTNAVSPETDEYALCITFTTDAQ